MSGDSEVLPVKTTATGIATIAIAVDSAVTGAVRTTDVAAWPAHIHVGAAGKNGPAIVPL